VKISDARLERLIEEATVDAYNDSEQRVGFLTMIEENLDLPFMTCILGAEVRVERMDMISADEIVAVCRRVEHARQFRYSNCRCPSRRRGALNGSRRIGAGRGCGRGAF